MLRFGEVVEMLEGGGLAQKTKLLVVYLGRLFLCHLLPVFSPLFPGHHDMKICVPLRSFCHKGKKLLKL